MEFQQLKALLSVAETGSVTQAARQLMLTQPAVSKQLRALEEELGEALFDRTTKPLITTRTGKAALEQARRILQMSEDLRLMVHSDAGNPKGEFRLGVVSSLAGSLIPALAREFLKHHPSLHLRITSGWSNVLRREVAEGQLNAAVVLAPSKMHIPNGLEATHVSNEAVSLMSSTKTPLRGVVSPEDLHRYSWVVSRDGCAYRALLKRTLEEAGIQFSVTAEVSEIDLQLDLVSQGLGLGIIARRTLPQQLEEIGIQTFSLPRFNLSLAIWIIHRQSGPIVSVAFPTVRRTVFDILAKSTPDGTRRTSHPGSGKRSRRIHMGVPEPHPRRRRMACEPIDRPESRREPSQSIEGLSLRRSIGLSQRPERTGETASTDASFPPGRSARCDAAIPQDLKISGEASARGSTPRGASRGTLR